MAACREAIRRAIPGRFDELFCKLDDALYDLADKSETNSFYTTYFDSLRVLRSHRHEILSQFLRDLEEDKPETLAESGQNSRAVEGKRRGRNLAPMGEATLEENLAVANLISKGESRYRTDLLVLRRHLAALRGQQDIDSRADPLGPHRLCNAFKQALRSVEDVELAIKLVVYKLFDKQVMDQLGSVYARCREFTDRRGSTIAAGLEPSELRVSLSAEPESARRPPQADAVAREGRDLTDSDQPDAGRYSRMGFTDLQRLLRRRRSDDAGSADRVVVDTDELMSVLSRLQEATGLDVDTSELRRRLNDELRQGGGGRDRALGRVDEDTLDLVLLLFEHVLHGNDIPDALKSPIGRLQVPFLKVALQDKSVFDDKHHPARRLLNHLAEAAMGWGGEVDSRSPDSLNGRVEWVVDQVVARCDGDSAVLAELDVELCALLAREQNAAKSREAKVRRELELRERKHITQRFVKEAIVERLRGRAAVPEAISCLLYEGWQQVLLDAYLRDGPAGTEWNDAIRTVDRLVWSVQPKRSSEDRRELLRSIPELLRTLREELARVSYDQRRLARWFKELQALHIAALRGGPVAPAQSGSDVRLPNAAVEAPPPRAAGTSDGQDFSYVDAAVCEVAGLEPGTWIEVRRDNGDLVRVKLAWRSPQSGINLFVDHRGRKALELDGKGIMTLQQQGILIVLGEAPIVDRAMEAVVQTLKGGAES